MSPHADNFDLQRYFERIAYTGSTGASLADVTAILHHQLMHIPFENLDVLSGKGVSLEPANLVDKLVHRRRGGYCYEVNGLFAMTLTALDVPWRFVGCRPMTYPMRRPRTHMALLAQFDGEEWLCDAGFGSYGLRAPICLGRTGEVCQDDDVFELLPANGHEYVLRARVEGDWVNQYGFDLSPHEWIDFLPANWLNSTHPETLFMQHRIVTRQTPQGRVTLFDDRLKTVTQGVVDTRQIAAHELDAVLREIFGLEYGA